MVTEIRNSFLRPVILCCVALFFHSCVEIGTRKEVEINRMIEKIRQTFVPDSRTGIFEIHIRREAGGWIIEGLTDQPEVLDRLIDSLERKSISYRDQVKILPDEALGGMTAGLVNISVANLRTDPTHAAELCTQAMLGTPLRVLQKRGDWHMVQTPDKYIGWLDGGGLVTMSEADYKQYQTEEKIIFMEIWGKCYQEPGSESLPVSDLVAGCILLFSDEQEDFFKVKFPDGRIGYVKKTEAESLVEWIDSRNPTEGNLVKTARQFMGIPYLWGGTSPKAVDCSGYTKTVYFMNGIILPRDASQQDDIGMLVDDQKYFSRLLPGDLLFFGSAPTDSTEEKVVHVGMWIGNMKFIHSSGDVHISSMDFNASDFDEYNYNRYLKSKRILNSQYLDELFIRKYY